jgi:hypothetical protein
MSFNGLVQENLKLAAIALRIGHHHDLGVLPQIVYHSGGDEKLPSAVDLLAELADEHARRD